MSKYSNLREEELKNKVARDWFSAYDNTRIIGNIDFCIAPSLVDEKTKLLFAENDLQKDIPSMLWAEAKKNIVKDINENFVQLILTIGKERTIDTFLPPAFLGAFDAEKIAFIPFHKISQIFNQNDFNWNVTPSDHSSKEFIQLYKLVKDILENNALLFDWEENESELKKFIKSNFKSGISSLTKIKVNKNNFVFIYQKWCKQVMPTIRVDWNMAKKAGILSADFFLADLLSQDNKTIKEKLFVLLSDSRYILDREIDENGFETSKQVAFKDNQKSYNQFWNLYERPPKVEYWDYIIERRDLLVPQDIRERKGSFFTPQIWVQKSQEYIASVLGENWQEEYVVWDCCAGTGNLLNGLTNKRNIWASTLDKADVEVMKDRVANGAQLYEDHIFQFDFLNDSFNNLPEGLRQIVNDPEKRKKLIVYINPPYAEAANARTSSGTGFNRAGVARDNLTYEKYKELMGLAQNELFAQFVIRIYLEIPECYIGQFSTVKIVSYPSYDKFRDLFRAKLERMFIVPANTFDNVNGKFPIGFFIWNTQKSIINNLSKNNPIESDIYEVDGSYLGTRYFYSETVSRPLTKWLQQFHDKQGQKVAYLRMLGSDVQNKNGVFISNELSRNDYKKHLFTFITRKNFLFICIYYSVRHVIEDTWITHNDQFLYPSDGWKDDNEFHFDCLMYTLFGDKNRISTENGTNHWIPFSEEQVGSKNSFESHFMSDYLKELLSGKAGKSTVKVGELDFEGKREEPDKREYCPSEEAKAVYDAGLLLWRYYFMKQNINPNASFYDIRKYFQGETNGRMNNDSNDETYSHYIADLRSKQKLLAKKIEQKVYKYGFLK